MENKKEQFIRLYNAEADAVFRYCLLRTSQSEVAKDLTQDAFMKFWDSFSSGRDDIKYPRAFLFRITKNLVIDWYRKKKSSSLDSLLDEEGVNREDLLLDKTGEEIEISSDAKMALRKIEDLPKIYREVVYLRFVEDLKPKEIAEILSESVNVVSVRITRGIEALRKITGFEK